jgi:hypothetical protein
MFKRGDFFLLAAALASFLYSNALYFGWHHPVDREGGIYVGHWVSSILITLVYLRQAQVSSRR